MKNFHLGIDFGTYQSKACIYNLESGDHEFFQFDRNNYFIPSRVVKKRDNTFGYGDFKSDAIEEEYRYFKMESADDEDFHFVTFNEAAKHEESLYNFNEEKSFTSEFISVIYLTYVQLVIKEYYKNIVQSKAKSGGGVLGRLFSRTETSNEEITFTTRIGIPTEWSQKNNMKRKRKFESILFISEKLQNIYQSKNIFEQTTSNDLIFQTKQIYKEYKQLNKEQFDKELNNMGLSVYPETAAGLNFIINSKQLVPGHYAAFDIGAGTTDVSFFQIFNDRIKYFASESYIIASNDVYNEFNGGVTSMDELNKAQRTVQNLIDADDINPELERTLKNVRGKLEKLIYKLFNKRVYYFNSNMVKSYKNQSIILYGGGSQLPYINSDNLLIHDNGQPGSLNIEFTYLEKIEIERFSKIINIRPNDDSWKPVFPMLVVALGLSYINHTGDADWFDEEFYNDRDGDNRRELIPHPTNEDCYIYDVLRS